jgi:hypothetical protein
MGEQSKGISRGNLEFLTPTSQDLGVIGKQAGDKRARDFIRVFRADEGHRQRQGEGIGIAAPLVVVGERQPIVRVGQATDAATVVDRFQGFGHRRKGFRGDGSGSSVGI